MKIIDNKIFCALLWYTLIITIGVIIIDLVNLVNIIATYTINEILLFIILLIFELFCLFVTIKFLRNPRVKYSFIFILIYWGLQILFFGIKGNSFCFTTGPEMVVNCKYIGSLEFGYFVKFWTNEISLQLNAESDRIYFGISLIPFLITIVVVILIRRNLVFLKNKKNPRTDYVMH